EDDVLVEREMVEQRLEVGGEGVVVVAGGGLRGATEAAPVVADAAVAGGEQRAFLALPGVAVQRVAVDQHDRRALTAVPVVDLDVGAVLTPGGHERHGGSSLCESATGAPSSRRDGLEGAAACDVF